MIKDSEIFWHVWDFWDLGWLFFFFFRHPNASVPVFSISEQPRCLAFLSAAVNKEDNNGRFALPVWLAATSLVWLTVVSDKFDARSFSEEPVYDGGF